jgi:hypothetical protein
LRHLNAKRIGARFPLQSSVPPMVTSVYADKHCTLKCISAVIQSSINLYAKTTGPPERRYYAPYLAVCQSSGMGKTKTALELHRNYLLFYICLRPAEESCGAPQQTHFVADLFRRARSEKEVVRVLLSSFEIFLCEFVNSPNNPPTPTTADQFYIESNSIDGKFWKMVKNRYELGADAYGNAELSNMKAHAAHLSAQISLALSNAGCKQTQLLFVFDGASLLNNEQFPIVGTGRPITPLALLRRGLTRFDRRALFSLFLDTTPSIAVLPPAEAEDPSARCALLGGLHFPPFVHILGHGILPVVGAEKLEETVQSGSGTNAFRLRYNRFDQAAISRPGFAYRASEEIREAERDAASAVEITELAWSGLIQYGIHKLLPGHLEDRLESTLTLMAARFNVLPTDGVRRQRMVASHLATLSGVSVDRAHLEIKYAAEPVVGEAVAAHFCRRTEKSWVDNFEVYLKDFVDARRSGMVSVVYPSGSVGGFCAALLLARAVDKYQCSTCTTLEAVNFGAPSPLVPFLSSLLTAKFVKALHLPDGLSNGFVRFTQFVKTDYTLEPSMLVEGLRRGVGFYCKDGEEGADLVIPVLLGRRGTTSSFRDITESDVSAVVVQVQNVEVHTGTTASTQAQQMCGIVAAGETIFQAYPDKAFLSVLMYVGAARADAKRSACQDMVAIVNSSIAEARRTLDKRRADLSAQQQQDAGRGAVEMLNVSLEHLRVMESRGGPCILVETLNTHYSCATEQELGQLRLLVRRRDACDHFGLMRDELLANKMMSEVELDEIEDRLVVFKPPRTALGLATEHMGTAAQAQQSAPSGTTPSPQPKPRRGRPPKQAPRR